MNILQEIKDLTGRWFCRRSIAKKEDKRPRHLISTWYIDDKKVVHAIAYCGAHLKNPLASDARGPWDPEDHLDMVCPECLKWWRDMQPKEDLKAGTAES